MHVLFHRLQWVGLLLLIWFSAGTALAQHFPFPDTGQTQCYNNTEVITPCPASSAAFCGQDAQNQPRLARSYTKLGVGEAVLGDEALHADQGGPWIMTRDEVTGLIWEVKTSANRHQTFNWNAARNYAAGLTLGGFNDWRLPTVKELVYLLDYGKNGPAIDAQYFRSLGNQLRYWTATGTANPSFANYAWYVKLDEGIDDFYQKTFDQVHVMAVRGDAAGAGNQFVDNGDGTLTDEASGLTWMRCSVGQSWTGSTCTGTATRRNWEQALAHVKNANDSGHLGKSDWRLPNRTELASLVNHLRHSPAVDTGRFPQTVSSWYWTSTTRTQDPAGAWVIHFKHGDGLYAPKTNSQGYARLVRGGLFGSLEITITPAEAVSAGAQWRRVGTTDWHDSVHLENKVPTGNYQVEFKPISGWDTPDKLDVTVAANSTATGSGVYVRHTGSLQVLIGPKGARDGGAQWRRVDTVVWRDSGDVETEIPTGSYQVEFKKIDDWHTPANLTVVINKDRTTSSNGTYTQYAIQHGPDFDGDRKRDILWRHTNGQVAIWLMDGTVRKSSGSPGSVGTQWTIAGVGDFDGDGKSDILWRHTNGQVAIWLMDGTVRKSSGSPGSAGTHWAIAGVGDFDGDGKSDILWHQINGDVAIWLMDGTVIKSSGNPPSVGTQWTIAGVGDFDGDGKSDILWWHNNGDVAIWLMDGTARKSSGNPPSVDTNWTIAGVGDFDGDGKSDILWRHINGDVGVWLMDGTVRLLSSSPGSAGTHWAIAGVGDFDGDGKSDILWRHINGDVAIWLMDGVVRSSIGNLGRVDSQWQIQ